MNAAVIGIDTSCYTTSCAAVGAGGQLLASERMLLPVGPGERGLRQSDGVFAHIRQFDRVLEGVMRSVRGMPIRAVCVSEKPTDDASSYMPVFQTGLAFAKALALSHDVPLYTTTHQRGHLRAAQIGMDALHAPYTALHISGGTTDFLSVKPDGRIECFFTSQDLHAGQLFDRVGVRMGLAFPAGKQLETLALGHTPSGRYPAVLGDRGLCLSGVEAAALRDLESGSVERGQIACELYDVLARLIVKTIRRFHLDAQPLLAVGGVASSSCLRQRLKERMDKEKMPCGVVFGNADFCTDNAAGVAFIGLEEWRKANG